MPWRKTDPEQEHRRFIERWEVGGVSFMDLCHQFGISAKTGYKRVRRFEELGWDGLGDVSRAPHSHPNQTALEVARQVERAKRAHPTWGPRKLIPWLQERHPQVSWPAPSTAGGILQRAGLVQRRRRIQRTAPWSQPFASADAPNDVWSIDFKGWFRTGDGWRCDPLTVADAASRYLLVCDGLQQPRGPAVQRVLERAFREYGLPRAIRSDNGPPFASTGLGGLSPLAVWWIKLGVVPERIAPGHPEQNGRLERLHRTLNAETASPARATLRAQQRAFDAFRRHYNQERPHEALGQQPPASFYSPSPRRYPSSVPEPVYESEVLVRRVRSNGEIKWKGNMVYLSEALRCEPVGLAPEDDRFWTIRFGPLQIGVLDTHACKVFHTPTKVLPMCLV